MGDVNDRHAASREVASAAGWTDKGSPLSRELRLGLVCYGGVSLAIYMHGITVELQRLVAASAEFCRNPGGPNPFRMDSTERVYWEAMRGIAETNGGVALRVVVDVIAGTSAGGINGIVLAKALARGLQQDPLREVWFDRASLLKLLLPTFWPFRRGKRVAAPWAPLNGQRMSMWAYAALQEMNRKPLTGPAEGLDLVPEGNELDLFVTTTDYTGFRRTIEMFDPETVHDLEYRHILHFHYDPQSNGKTAFGPEDDRVLTLAVRSTSSFPGAFPPVTLGEVEAVAGKFEEEELSPHFTAYFLEGAKPASSFFLDGGVLNNKPFDHAVRTIMERTADRQVDRRLLFIEPHPVDVAPDRTERPSWLRTILASVINIPSHQPIADALTELARHNLRAVEIRQLIALTEPHVFELIQDIADDPDNSLDSKHASALPALSLDIVESWADEVRKKAQRTAGTSYLIYETIKVGEVLADLSAGLCTLMRYPATSRHATLVHRLVRRWAVLGNLLFDDAQGGDKEALNRHSANAEGRLQFLKTFDLNFRRRRLRFLIRCVNETYPNAASDLRRRLDQVKQRLYRLIRMLRDVQSARWAEDVKQQDLKTALVSLFGPHALAPLMVDAAPTMPVARLEARLDDYMKGHRVELEAALDQLAAVIEHQLSSYWSAQQDSLSWLLRGSNLPTDLLQKMLSRYIGYAHWDTVLYPLIAMSGVIEPDSVEVIRISPSDTKLLEPTGVEQRLKGVAAFHFGAFLKRSFRENDFLWGRLDGVERLLKLLGDMSEESGAPEKPKRLIWEGFKAVLDAESPVMRGKDARKLVTGLRAQVEPKVRAQRLPDGSAVIAPGLSSHLLGNSAPTGP